jgi:DNA (cytosine-5)-methyltransferase 1
MDVLTELNLFSGFGGGLLATQHLLGWRTVCYVEWDEYAIEVLKARIRDGYLDDAPVWDNAFTFDGRPWAGLVDVVSAGFPCQPFSVAGKGLAENDSRNGWPATIRIIREVRPRIAWLENVPGLIAKPYFRTILGELSEAGYCVEWDCVSAAEVGALHKRERLWIVAHAKGGAGNLSELTQQESFHFGGDGNPRSMANAISRGKRRKPKMGQRGQTEPCGSGPNMADPNSERREKFGASLFACEEGQFGRGSDEKLSLPPSLKLGKFREQADASREGERWRDNGRREAQDVRGEWWAVEPRLGRVADGVANRLDRLRGIGNGQVPDVVVEAWERLTHA